MHRTIVSSSTTSILVLRYAACDYLRMCHALLGWGQFWVGLAWGHHPSHARDFPKRAFAAQVMNWPTGEFMNSRRSSAAGREPGALRVRDVARRLKQAGRIGPFRVGVDAKDQIAMASVRARMRLRASSLERDN